MRDIVDETLSNFFGKRSNYTVEEIEQAQARKRKLGGTLLENLEAITGRSLPNAINTSSLTEKSPFSNDGARKSMAEIASPEELEKEINAFTKDLQDFVKETEGTTGNSATVAGEKENVVISGDDALDSFNGIEEEIAKTVFGQQDFIHKLLIAFKRPFVISEDEEAAKNSIYITGNECTGRHMTLKALTSEMAKKRLLKSEEISVMDLSLYPSAGEEKLFLQDLYSCLSGKNEVILFENYAECHPSFLTRLSDLVIKGKCMLSERYIMQKGQLVNVTNSLASETVGSFSAKGKYLVFISNKSVEKLADSMGAPFINALGDVCQSEELSEEAYRQASQRELDELVEKSDKQLRFKLETDEKFIDYSIKMSEKRAGLKGILKFYDDLTKALAELRLEKSIAKNAPVKLCVENDIVEAQLENETIPLMSVLPGKYTGELDAVKAELEDIVGLKEIKEYILSLEEYYNTQKRRRDAGLKAGEVNKHMIFTGNPGTGKTTIARVISRYLKAIGVLTGGQLVEVSRADLVGRYVGHTAPLTNQVISSAIGGVLFIDEAYSLYRGNDDAFGLEAIDTLVKGIEDNRDNLVVILAGYSKEMEEFLESNSGLKSRFPNIINFPDYTGEELLAIGKITAKSKGYVIDEGAESGLLAYFNAVQMVRAKDAGNGRLVRNKIEEAILNQSKRLVAEPDADLSTLTSMDFDLSDVNGDCL